MKAAAIWRDLPIQVIRRTAARVTLAGMSNLSLSTLSNELADLAAAGAASVVQVIGARRPASGVVHGADTIVTTARAIGREDGLRIRVGDAEAAEADLAGWDPATGIAVLRTRAPLTVPAPSIASSEPRPGEIVVALARSWSHALTVSAGVVAVVGGPLRTGRRGQIPRVMRLSAPMHDGFAGGAVFNASGTPRRGFVGVAVQPVQLAASQRTDDRERGLLVVGVTTGSPADTAGLIVGDILLGFDGKPTESPDDLLDLLVGTRIGNTVVAQTLRGGTAREAQITVAERKRE